MKSLVVGSIVGSTSFAESDDPSTLSIDENREGDLQVQLRCSAKRALVNKPL